MRERAGRRRLAAALENDPSLLRTGRGPAPFCVAKLLMALREAGAEDGALPRCGVCGRACPYVGSRAGGRWGCSPCFDTPEVCAGCGNLRRVVSRDRNGEPRCAKCPDTEGDPLNELIALVAGIDPDMGADVVLGALGRATARPASQRRLAWAVLARPELLSGAGHLAPTPAMLRFIGELARAGARNILEPACPRCHQVKALSKLLAGQRVCRACYARHNAVPCAGCGAIREPATRDEHGRPLCPNCLIKDPVNLEHCANCGCRKPVAVRLDDGPRCQNCRPRAITEGDGYRAASEIYSRAIHLLTIENDQLRRGIDQQLSGRVVRFPQGRREGR